MQFQILPLLIIVFDIITDVFLKVDDIQHSISCLKVIQRHTEVTYFSVSAILLLTFRNLLVKLSWVVLHVFWISRL